MRRDARTRTVAAAITALAAVGLAIVMEGKRCGDGEDGEGPADAVRALLAASRVGDREGAFALLGPATRARLEKAAARAAALEGGRPRPVELLAVGPPEAPPARIVVRARDAGRATVELIDLHGVRTRLEVVREAAGWRVELPEGGTR